MKDNKDNFEKRKKLLYDFVSDSSYVPMKFKEIAHLLQVSKEQRAELREIIAGLEMEGKLSKAKDGRYKKGVAQSLQGRYKAHERGFGFVILDQEEQEDIFISEANTNHALQGDIVKVALLPATNGKRREGKIVQVVERGTNHIVGLFQKSKNYGFVLPDSLCFSKDIFIPREKSKEAQTGQKVVVELTFYGDEKRKPEGKVIEVLGFANDPGTDILSLVKNTDIPIEFPVRVLNQAEKVPDSVSDADREGRKDIRSSLTITIDGEDAKDLDDAITLTKEGEIYTLGVHIADVTNYVQEKSALDREALKRGTSIYLADRVIPMLPPKLSNGICSLNAKVDRLALSCIMQVNEQGELVGQEIVETVICVDRRMSYTEVSAILEDAVNSTNVIAPEEVVLAENTVASEESMLSEDTATKREYPEDLLEMLQGMKVLSEILRKKRYKRGGIDFDFPEAKVLLDKAGKPIEVKVYERNVASKIIEDFMLLANETVAETYFWQEMPFVYRVHEAPENEKFQKLNLFLNNIGYAMHIGKNEVKSKEIQKLLAQVSGTPEEALVSRLALRSMKQAKYTPENLGHFGLAATYYTHFTSPIRRYSDLQIHRIIKDILRGRMNEAKREHYTHILPEVTKHISVTERQAEEIERDTIKLKKVEYMQAYIGAEFEGVISSITKWGIYVELPNTIEGLVHVMNMKDDHYDYIEERCEMVGEHTRKAYRLGETVHIQVLEADTIRRTIDFVLI